MTALSRETDISNSSRNVFSRHIQQVISRVLRVTELADITSVIQSCVFLGGIMRHFEVTLVLQSMQGQAKGSDSS
jgi:hypothetical protein